MIEKPIISAADAAGRIKDGNSVMVGGFMNCGAPHTIISALKIKGPKNLTLICNDTAVHDFKTGKVILTQPIAREQVHKLLTTGKTDLLENFVSNKTRRKFKAFLAFDKKEGKVSFEFQPRAAKAPAAKKVAAKKAA